jgi:hypothetical protein
MEFKPNRLPSYSEADLIREIIRVVRVEYQGKVPNTTQFEKRARVSLTSIYRIFGSYPNALAKAGFSYKTRTYSVTRRKLTPEAVNSSLREVLKKSNGNYFTYQFYRTNGGAYAVDTIKSVLGTNWPGALKALGAKPRPRIVHVHRITAHSQRLKKLASLTNSQLINELGRVWQACGKCPTRPQFDQASEFKAALYERRFGSWSKAIAAYCKATGHSAPKLNGVPIGWTLDGKLQTSDVASKEVLLEELRRISNSLGDMQLTYMVYKKLGGAYHIATFQNHFGRWENAVKAIGITPVRRSSYTREELFDEMQRLWEYLGRQPTFGEMEKLGKITPVIYHRKFKGWTNAVHAFCHDRNSDSALAVLPPNPEEAPQAIESKNEEVVDHSPASAADPLPIIVVHATARGVPPKLRFRVFLRDNFICQACGRSPKEHPGLVIEADHKTAWTNGGETVLENLQTLCSECNRGKSNL